MTTVLFSFEFVAKVEFTVHVLDVVAPACMFTNIGLNRMYDDVPHQEQTENAVWYVLCSSISTVCDLANF